MVLVKHQFMAVPWADRQLDIEEENPTLDKGLFQKVRSNEKAFRTAFDPMSILNANSKRMKTLPNISKKFRSGLMPLDAAINGFRAFYKRTSNKVRVEE